MDRKLTLYLQEKDRVGRRLAYRWIMERARDFGIEGGSVYRAIDSFGEHGRIHEARFYELSCFSLMIIFVTDQAKAERFLDLLRDTELDLFYTIHEITSGRIR